MSSGIIVSTGLGSTGWMKSVIAGAAGIVGGLAGKDAGSVRKLKMPWDAQYLHFFVREPFPSKTSATELVFGKIEDGNKMALTSGMPDNGVIFSDGIESDYLEFNSGVKAEISLAEKQGHLVI